MICIRLKCHYLEYKMKREADWWGGSQRFVIEFQVEDLNDKNL